MGKLRLCRKNGSLRRHKGRPEARALASAYAGVAMYDAEYLPLAVLSTKPEFSCTVDTQTAE